MTIKNIIFDLGGVIIDLDYQKTSDAFSKLGALNFDAVYSQSKQDSLFDDYETGQITSDIFRQNLQKKLNIAITNEIFDMAWNAMLLDISTEKLNFIKELRKKYRTFLFSNTNEIHLKKFSNMCQIKHNFNIFNDCFEKEYYSHTFGKRKPNPDSFIAILNEHNLKADETLFIDDSLQHVVGAKKAGLFAIHLLEGKSIFDILSLDTTPILHEDAIY